jgi:hypothetical protein
VIILVLKTHIFYLLNGLVAKDACLSLTSADWLAYLCSSSIIDIKRPKIDCLSFVMCPLLAQLKIGFFFAAAVYSTNEANKAGLKQSIFLDVYE